MGLREIAEQDLGAIIEDDVHGFGWTISVTDPAGVNVPDLVGFSDDIAQLIDPDTGQAVSGRLASCAGLGLPQGVADAGIKPWLVAFLDINGNAYTFKVAQSNPDRALGIVTCVLETYVP
jgi:hypothetical protein